MSAVHGLGEIDGSPELTPSVRPPGTHPTVLITSTCWWPFPPRLAMAFNAAGFRVEAICPAHHPLLSTASVARAHRYRALRPLASLDAAIRQTEPALIVPCDDRAVTHLHALYSRAGVRVASAIERSLGDPGGFEIVDRRCSVIELAREEGVLAPEMTVIRTIGELEAGLESFGFPAVVKADGTWGGHGVAIARNAATAQRAFLRLRRPLSLASMAKRLLIDRDPFPLRARLNGERPTVNLQRHVVGRPANAAVACWQGEILAGTCVEVVATRDELSASTVVRIIEHPDMMEAARRIVRRLRLSGFCGFDFMLEAESRTAHLIEINTRSTPLTHIVAQKSGDLVGALAGVLLGTTPRTPKLVAGDLIAHFPQAWLLKPDDDILQTAYHDVPWADPGLVRELVKLPWPERSAAARALNRIRKRMAGTSRASVVEVGTAETKTPAGLPPAPTAR